MKRVLTATTAIAGMSLAGTGAQAADPINIGLSGFMNAYYSAGTDSLEGGTDQGGNSVDLGPTGFQDATINFSGSTTLDNGIEVGARFELESFGHPADEQYIYFDGSFGNIKLGGHNSVIYQMGWVASGYAYNGGVPIISGWTATLAGDGSFYGNFDNPYDFRKVSASTFLDVHDDANTISYQTPRFAGFKFGASYTPRSEGVGAADQLSATNQDTDDHNGVSLAANFSREFQGVSINAAGGWAREDVANNDAASSTAPVTDDTINMYNGHLTVGAAGFSLGGGVAVMDSDGTGSTGANTGKANDDGHSWAVGAGYGTGPWQLGVTWFQAEIEGDPNDPGEDENRFGKIGLDYTLGPGITLSAAVLRATFDGGDANDVEATRTVGVLGTSVTF